MGLSFHYSGSFNRAASLALMIEEVKEIAEAYNWPYHIYDDTFPENTFGKTAFTQNIYGISFTPPECETVWFCFLSNGKMSSPLHLHLYGNSADKKEQEYLYMLSVKTQYAGQQIHQFLIELIRYLSNKYFTNFTLSDEGQYWETGDEKLLKEIFERYTYFIHEFTSGLENNPRRKEETFETYFTRLMEEIHNKNKK